MPEQSMREKVCLVTGGSSGIGRATAEALAVRGATVVTVSRGSGSGDEVAAELRKKTGGDVQFMPADLSSVGETRSLAARFGERFRRLDVLVNNAGVFMAKRQETEDGFEKTFALNHLAPFLLTHLLLPPLLTAAPSRIVVLSSEAERMGKMHFDDLMLKNYGGWKAYGQSKLANLLFTYELARRLEGTGVTVNALHPGFVGTNFGANNGGFASLALKVLKPFTRSPEKGAETAVWLATSLDVEGVTGKYFKDKETLTSKDISYDEGAQRRLWEESARLVDLTKEEAQPLREAAA